ncbi:hypothetical protein CHEID_03570 [Corynebacterium heidelbergense]|nr:hypothetical protein CHEID_03570 [Corynebacterium heidelbergense]
MNDATNNRAPSTSPPTGSSRWHGWLSRNYRGDAGALRVDLLKERIYIAFTTLAACLALGAHPPSASAAVFTAELIAHLVAHQRWLGRPEIAMQDAISLASLSTITPVLAVLLAAVFQLVSVPHALYVCGPRLDHPGSLRLFRGTQTAIDLVAAASDSRHRGHLGRLRRDPRTSRAPRRLDPRTRKRVSARSAAPGSFARTTLFERICSPVEALFRSLT